MRKKFGLSETQRIRMSNIKLTLPPVLNCRFCGDFSILVGIMCTTASLISGEMLLSDLTFKMSSKVVVHGAVLTILMLFNSRTNFAA